MHSPNSPDLPLDPATSAQRAFLQRHNLPYNRSMSYREAMGLIDQYVSTRRELQPTPRQIEILQKHNQWRDGMGRGEAFDRIQRIFARG